MVLGYIKAALRGSSIPLGEVARPSRQAHRRVGRATFIYDRHFVRPSKFAGVTGDRLSLGFPSG